jgi:galactose mutarotase-like enzyme
MELRAGRARATLLPERGALISQWSVGEDELLYMDAATLADPTKNVRGGIPVLFPSPGKLTNDRYGRGAMKQHGFARTLPWEVMSSSADRATLRLRASDATRVQYPWDFDASLTFTLTDSSLRIEQHVVAGDNAEAMPFGFGFHPYFAVPVAEKAVTRIETSATRAFDNVHKRVIDLHGIDLASGEVDLHLLDHDCSSSSLAWFHKVVIEASNEYRRWVIWTLPDKPFVCLEPWTCPGDALNTGEQLITLPATKGEWRGFVAYSVATDT